MDGNKETLKMPLYIGKSNSEEIKKSMESYQRSNSSILMHLPTANDITILSRAGISNYYNNCYMGVIIHSILGTVITK